jgi:imidazolonepropionase
MRGSAEPRRGSALEDVGLIADGAVLIRDGVIEQVGPTRRVENLARAHVAREIDATGRVVMPGFVDSHTHLVFGCPWLRDYESRIASGRERGTESLQASVQAVHSVSTARLEFRARAWVGRMIRHGTTTLEAKSGYGLDESGEMKILRALASLDGKPLDVQATFLAAQAIPPDRQRDLWGYLYWLSSQLMPRVRQRRLARFADVICGPSGLSTEQAERFLEMARDLGFLLKLHADHQAHSGAARLGVELGAVSVDHLEYADAEDIRLLARSSTIATLLPGCGLHQEKQPYAPAGEMIDAGVAVALATGFDPAVSPTYSMQMALSLACLRLRMTPAQAIAAATINGAHALQMADRVGSLEPGKQADLIILNVSDFREVPYYFGGNAVFMTIKQGRVLYREAELAPAEDAAG